ncbi:hypothetical protein HK096_005097 [Nowakowskiella sp. JEL0078]|nr:hypothetical protein HK096_005097 [Nowakowskiella sp. JEL0078]
MQHNPLSTETQKMFSPVVASSVSPALGSAIHVHKDHAFKVEVSVAVQPWLALIVERAEVWTNAAIKVPSEESTSDAKNTINDPVDEKDLNVGVKPVENSFGENTSDWIAIPLPLVSNDKKNLLASGIADKQFVVLSFSGDLLALKNGEFTVRLVVANGAAGGISFSNYHWLGTYGQNATIIVDTPSKSRLSTEKWYSQFLELDEFGKSSTFVPVRSEKIPPSEHAKEGAEIATGFLKWPKNLQSSSACCFPGLNLLNPSSELPYPTFSLLSVSRHIVIERSQTWWVEPRTGKDKMLKTPYDIEMILWEQDNGSYAVIIALPPTAMRYNDESHISLKWDPKNVVQNDEYTLYIAASSGEAGSDVYSLLSIAMIDVQQFVRSLQQTKPEPVVLLPDIPGAVPNQMWDHFGWCTWDAFYQTVTEEKIMTELQEFIDDKVPVEFLLIDDGWQDYNEKNQLVSIKMNTTKFPNSFEVVKSIKKKGVKYVGVWHTLIGYWNGIAPDGQIAKDYKLTEVTKRDGNKMLLVDSSDINRFYHDFETTLRSHGVDFVKVDHQVLLTCFRKYFAQPDLQGFFDDIIPEDSDRLWESYQNALIQNAALHGPTIWCMAESPNVFFSTMIDKLQSKRNTSAGKWQHALRTSDDFYPNRIYSHTWHIYVNAVATIFSALILGPHQHPSSPIYSPAKSPILIDWDMFHSFHQFAPLHAAARVVSGGSIYVSDKPNQHDPVLLKSLIVGALPSESAGGARSLRCQSPGFPTRDCLFSNHTKDARLLKVANRTAENNVAVLGLFNCRLGQGVTDGPILDTISVADVDGLVTKKGEFAAFFFNRNETMRLGYNDRVLVYMEPGKAEIVTFSPLAEVEGVPIKVGSFGLAEKINA